MCMFRTERNTRFNPQVTQMARHNLTLVTLNSEQIVRAKETNGSRKRITRALICGPYGQLFGTEAQCLKYFEVWDPAYRFEVAPGKFKSMFPNLFDKAVRNDDFKITEFQSTRNLTDKLIKASEAKPRIARNALKQGRRAKIRRPSSPNVPKRKGFFARMFRGKRNSPVMQAITPVNRKFGHGHTEPRPSVARPRTPPA